MINGKDQLAIIDEHIATARTSIDAIHRRLESVRQRLTEIRNQIAEQFRRLAQFRLDELTANRLIAHLDDTDRAVVNLLERRSMELSRLESEIQQELARQSSLKSEREEAVRRRDELVTRIDRQGADILAHLGGLDAYQTQEKIAREATARAERAESKAAWAEADREEKGTPYREDALFMYLWKRRFLTPDYTVGGLTRAMDGWIAKLINYSESRRNYFLLTELPLRLREHAERQKVIAAQESQKLRDMEDQALQMEDILRKKEAIQAAQKEIDEIEKQIEEAEKRHEILLGKRSSYSSASDELSRQAIQLQVSEIKNDNLANLYREAKATGRPDDDVIVSRIRDLMDEEQFLSAEIKNLQSDLHRQRDSFQEIEELRRRFRRSHYDSGHSYFPGGFEMGALLAMLMSGRASGGDIWGRIGRKQQFRLPRHGPTTGKEPFPGGFGSGGFRTGGGF